MNLLDNETSSRRHVSEPLRKMPVLFHLLDVSRSRAPQAPAEGPPLSAAAAHGEPAVIESASPEVLLPPVEPLPSLPSISDHSSEPRLALPAILEQPAAASAPAEPPALAAVEPTLDASGLAADEATTLTPPDDVLSPPAPRPEAQRPPVERRRKSKTPATEDWFAAHGKYIALLFVLALGGTIYLARINRRTPPVADTSDLQLEIETSPVPKSTPERKPATTIVADSAASAEASPAKLSDTTSTGSPQAELFPPTAPAQLASQATTASGPASSNLFPASATAETSNERLANRPSGPTEIVNHTLAAGGGTSSSATAKPPSTTPPAPTAPAPEPTYPHTGYPMTGLPATNYPNTNPQLPSYPATANAQALPQSAPPTMPQQPPAYQPTQYQPTQYQATQYQPTQYQPTQYQPAPYQPQGQPAAPPSDYRSAFLPPPPLPGAAPQPSWPQVPPPGGAPPQFPINSGTGTRYERTGSSLYQGLR